MKPGKEKVVRVGFITTALFVLCVNALLSLLYPENQAVKIPASVEMAIWENEVEEFQRKQPPAKPLLYFLQDLYKRYKLLKSLQGKTKKG